MGKASRRFQSRSPREMEHRKGFTWTKKTLKRIRINWKKKTHERKHDWQISKHFDFKWESQCVIVGGKAAWRLIKINQIFWSWTAETDKTSFHPSDDDSDSWHTFTPRRLTHKHMHTHANSNTHHFHTTDSAVVSLRQQSIQHVSFAHQTNWTLSAR